MPPGRDSSQEPGHRLAAQRAQKQRPQPPARSHRRRGGSMAGGTDRQSRTAMASTRMKSAGPKDLIAKAVDSFELLYPLDVRCASLLPLEQPRGQGVVQTKSR